MFSFSMFYRNIHPYIVTALEQNNTKDNQTKNSKEYWKSAFPHTLGESVQQNNIKLL